MQAKEGGEHSCVLTGGCATQALHCTPPRSALAPVRPPPSRMSCLLPTNSTHLSDEEALSSRLLLAQLCAASVAEGPHRSSRRRCCSLATSSTRVNLWCGSWASSAPTAARMASTWPCRFRPASAPAPAPAAAAAWPLACAAAAAASGAALPFSSAATAATPPLPNACPAPAAAPACPPTPAPPAATTGAVGVAAAATMLGPAAPPPSTGCRIACRRGQRPTASDVSPGSTAGSGLPRSSTSTPRCLSPGSSKPGSAASGVPHLTPSMRGHSSAVRCGMRASDLSSGSVTCRRQGVGWWWEPGLGCGSGGSASSRVDSAGSCGSAWSSCRGGRRGGQQGPWEWVAGWGAREIQGGLQVVRYRQA